ncbi:hypothetical protein BDR26DRAFT_896090, partial [Obelidium mucronatum]
AFAYIPAYPPPRVESPITGDLSRSCVLPQEWLWGLHVMCHIQGRHIGLLDSMIVSPLLDRGDIGLSVLLCIYCVFAHHFRVGLFAVSSVQVIPAGLPGAVAAVAAVAPHHSFLISLARPSTPVHAIAFGSSSCPTCRGALCQPCMSPSMVHGHFKGGFASPKWPTASWYPDVPSGDPFAAASVAVAGSPHAPHAPLRPQAPPHRFPSLACSRASVCSAILSTSGACVRCVGVPSCPAPLHRSHVLRLSMLGRFCIAPSGRSDASRSLDPVPGNDSVAAAGVAAAGSLLPAPLRP